ncbi:MAG: flagellar motor protein MotB [Elusimicrobia bacterium]|nr:flagellar motor protein MotB [Elusimicrobiota bacterium]
MRKRRRRLRDRRLGYGMGREWMIIYSDMTTNLMLFFLMLFALTRLAVEERSKVYSSIRKDFTTIQEKARFQEVIKIEKKTEDKIFELKNQKISDMAKIEISEKYINIQLPNPVLFDTGDVELNSQGREVLNKITQILKPIPHQIIVEGHTDDLPIKKGGKFISNWELSGARALSALNYMIQEGISPDRLSAVAYGAHHPIGSNETEEGRAQNRRIEINIVKEG